MKASSATGKSTNAAHVGAEAVTTSGSRAPERATAMHPPQIFISYRRDDAAGYARAVCGELARHFGAERTT